MQDPVVIASAARTPMVGFLGELASVTAPELGAAAIRATVERAGFAHVLLLEAQQKYDRTRGVAALCIGGGEATTVAVERIG